MRSNTHTRRKIDEPSYLNDFVVKVREEKIQMKLGTFGTVKFIANKMVRCRRRRHRRRRRHFAFSPFPFRNSDCYVKMITIRSVIVDSLL